MKNFKSIFLISFLLMLFIGNVGINIFKHACLESGVSVSYFIQNEHDCDSHRAKVNACCKAPSKKNNDCCTESVEYINVELDFFEPEYEFNFDFISVKTPDFYTCGEAVVEFEKSYIAHLYDDPPPLPSKFSRIRNQRFII